MNPGRILIRKETVPVQCYIILNCTMQYIDTIFDTIYKKGEYE